MKWYELSENVLIFLTHEGLALSEAIRQSQIPEIIEVVSTDAELALKHTAENIESLVTQILAIKPPSLNVVSAVIEIPVCYELALDLEEVSRQSNLPTEEIINLHQAAEYDMHYGFTPGFMYLSGLDPQLACERKPQPRTKIPAGAVGIGGTKTGIYSLESPGGWQIIGRTPITLFDSSLENPFVIPNGSRIKFKSIPKQEFDEWG